MLGQSQQAFSVLVSQGLGIEHESDDVWSQLGMLVRSQLILVDELTPIGDPPLAYAVCGSVVDMSHLADLLKRS